MLLGPSVDFLIMVVETEVCKIASDKSEAGLQSCLLALTPLQRWRLPLSQPAQHILHPPGLSGQLNPKQDPTKETDDVDTGASPSRQLSVPGLLCFRVSAYDKLDLGPSSRLLLAALPLPQLHLCSFSLNSNAWLSLGDNTTVLSLHFRRPPCFHLPSCAFLVTMKTCPGQLACPQQKTRHWHRDVWATTAQRRPIADLQWEVKADSCSLLEWANLTIS